MPRLPVVPDLGAYLREQRVAARLSLRELAERAGMSNPYLSQIERGLRKPSAEILGALADALDLSAEALYVRAGILDAPQRQGGVVAAVVADPALTDRQKRTLVDLYRLFADEPDAVVPSRPDEPGVGQVPAVGQGEAVRAASAGAFAAPHDAATRPAATDDRSSRRRSNVIPMLPTRNPTEPPDPKETR